MKAFIWLLIPILAACAPQLSTVKSKTDSLVDHIGCKTAKSHLFDVLLTGLDDEGYILDSEILKPLLASRIEETWKSLSSEQAKTLLDKILSFYQEVHGTLRKEGRTKILKESLAAFEVGVKDGVEFGAYTQNVQSKVEEINSFVEGLSLNCNEIPEEPVETPIETPENTSPVSFGSAFTVSVAYQSCSALTKAPMNESTPGLKGVKVTGTHSSGAGKKREIASLTDVVNSHYYIKGVQYGESCVKVSQSPLIYDFGGKPHTTSSQPKLLDLFKNAGSGTNVLGIDCSGFVFTALASGGAKLSAKTEMKASLVHGIPSKAYMNPSANGMDCIEHAKFGYNNGTLMAGDIVAISGHIIIIDEVGGDPFGFKKFTNKSQCDSLTYKDFDFIIAQSSPTKGAIGISRNTPQSYLKESSTIRTGLEYYAKQNCLAHFNQTDPIINYSAVKIVRHKNTPECRVPALTLKSQECVQSCFN